MGNKKKTLLWAIQFPQAEKPSYLFGTMHVQDKQAFTFIENAYQAIERCDKIALEFDLDEVPQHIDPQLIRLPAGQTLDQCIRPKVFNKMRRQLLKSYQVDLWQLRHFTPMFISNTVTSLLLAKDMPVALDEQLWLYAKAQNIPGFGIETYEEQLAILNRIPLDQQLKALVMMVRHHSAYRQKIKRMAELYATADIYRIYKAAKKSASGVRHLLLYDRNAIMAGRISEQAKTQSVFFAIGAGHLAGGKGVLRLLKHKGAKVWPIFNH
jgi:uncharacterized protein YbaP (TraB family)